MARCLIVGCGCRGQALAAALVRQGHAVRGTTRDPDRCAEIEQAGAEPFVGDPDRVGSIIQALDHVSVACVLLGTAHGSPEQLAALHGTRLEMLLQRTIDSTIHGIVYEARGSVDATILNAGAAIVRAICEHSRIPFALIEADPAAPADWLALATDGVARVLATSGGESSIPAISTS